MRGLISIVVCLTALGCGGETGTDAGAGMDGGGGGTDSGTTVDAGFDAGAPVDAGDFDAGPVCEGNSIGVCADGALECLCCPAGGPTQNCLCTTACNADVDCTDAARPRCNQPTSGGGGGPTGICTPMEFACAWGAVCASPDTPIATPDGERPIAELAVGDLVYTMHRGQLVARPLIEVHRSPVVDHAVVRTVLSSGRILEISGPHPTADGRLFEQLAPGDVLGGELVERVETVPYAHPYTHDILPDSDTGTYVAAGALIGSTLFR